jgi:hypothetical protein
VNLVTSIFGSAARGNMTLGGFILFVGAVVLMLENHPILGLLCLIVLIV